MLPGVDSTKAARVTIGGTTQEPTSGINYQKVHQKSQQVMRECDGVFLNL